MRHFLMMAGFAVLAGIVFGAVAKETRNEQIAYGVKVFLEFLVIGLALGWILYFLPL